MSSKILIVDDEKELVGLVSLHLKMSGYEVLIAYNGKNALELSQKENPDLVILDLMLPEMDGWEVCRILKANLRTKRIPIIMLSACVGVEDKIKGFELGADDYVTKPFSPRELMVRVKRILSRIEPEPPSPLKMSFGEIEVDLENFEIFKNQQVLDLTQKEKEIFRVLASHPGFLVTYEQLMDEIWDEDEVVEYGNIAVHIRHLREKLEKNPEEPELIKTVKGIGYRFEIK